MIKSKLHNHENIHKKSRLQTASFWTDTELKTIMKVWCRLIFHYY